MRTIGFFSGRVWCAAAGLAAALGVLAPQAAEAGTAPSLSSPTATAIGQTGATLGATVVSGTTPLTDRGTYWDTAAAPTANYLSAGGTTLDAFSHARTGMSQGTKYYYRGYAINSKGSAYSPDGSFYTEPGQASSISFSSVSQSGMTISWTAGAASDGAIVVMRAGDSAVTDPTDGTLHSANAAFGSGADLGSGSYVVYRSSGTSVAVSGLAAGTTYYVEIFAYKGTVADSGVDQGINYRQTSPLAGSQATAAAIWINPMSAATPMGTYYLGDTMGSWNFNFEIGQATWDDARVGIGSAADGSGYNWGTANWYEDGAGSNKRVRRDLTGYQYTTVGSHYVICQARAASGDTYTSKSGNGWSNTVAYPPADLSSAYFTCSAINNPGSQTATVDAVNNTSEIDLAWAKNAQSHNVMVVRKLSTGSWTEPTQGTGYSASATLGDGTVIYNGSATSFSDTGLAAGTTYDYKFYSVNNNYYSSGVTDQEATAALTVAIDNTGSPVAGDLTVGVADVVLFGFKLTPSGSINFTALSLDTAGTATSSDLSNFEVVYDADNSGTYNGGDSIVSDTKAIADPIAFAISGQTGFSAARRYLVIADVAAGATAGRTITCNIAAAGDVTTSGTESGTASGNLQTVAACTAPSAPTSLWASVTNATNFTAAWSGATGTPTNYYLDVSTNAEFGTAGGGGGGSGLLISQYTETSSGTVPKGVEIWNAGSTTVDFSVDELDILVGVNGGALGSVFTLNSGTLAAGAVMVVGTTDLVEYVDTTFSGSVLTEVEPFTYNGDDALQIKLGGVVQDTFGNPGSDPGTGWTGNGVQTYNQNISITNGINTGDTDGWTDPSTRFEVTYNNPVYGTGYDGFGTAPAGGGGSTPDYVPGYSNRTVGATSVSVTGLTVGVTYYYRVRAQNVCGTSDNSTTQNVTTASSEDTTGPVISNLGIVTKGDTSILDSEWSATSMNLFIDISDSTSGIDWATAPTWSLTNPANAQVVAPNAFITTGHTTGETSTTATDTISSVTFSAGTWKVGVRAQDKGGYATSQSFTFTAADDDTNSPALGGTSSDYGVYYNLPDNQYTSEYPGEFDIRDRLIEHVDALQSGDVGTLSTYTWSGQGTTQGFVQPLLEAMSNALVRGATVRLILAYGVDQTETFGGLSIDSLESGLGLVVSMDDTLAGIMHNKFSLFDYGAGDKWVFDQSANYTMAAASVQWNMAVDIQSDTLYDAFYAEATELLAGRFQDHTDKSHAHDGTRFSMQGSWGDNWVRFAPYPNSTTSNALKDITNEIAKADSEIYFALNMLTRRSVSDALIALCDANPSIRIHGAISQDAITSTDWDVEYAYLTNTTNYAGTNMVHFHSVYENAARTLSDDGTITDLIHAKWMVIDPFGTEPMVIHGSANWTATALEYVDGNDENVLFLRHGGIAAEFFENWTIMTGVFTDQVQQVASGAAMTVYAGTQSATYKGGATTNAQWEVAAANLLTNTLSLIFNVYDDPSGINRGTDTAATNMHVTVQNLCTDNVTNFVLSLSSATTTNSGSTSVWKFASFDAAMVGALMGTNAVTIHVPDADNDGWTGDTLWTSNQLVGYLCVPTTPMIALADNGTQVAEAGVIPGTTNHVLHRFQLSVTKANATLTNLSFTTAGTYASTDITNLIVWYSTDATWDGADTKLHTFSSSLGAGLKTTGALTQQINSGSTGYIFITADFAAAAVLGRTLAVSPAVATTNTLFAAGVRSGSTTAGGAQTIVAACTPAEVAFVQQCAYYTKFTDGGDIFDNGTTEMGMWAHGGNKKVVAWRNFRTDGSGGGSARELQPGDRVRISVHGYSPFGILGMSLNDGAATGSWDNRISNTRGYIECGNSYGDLYVTHGGGATSWSGIKPWNTTVTMEYHILSSKEFTANIVGQTPKYDLTMLNSPGDTDRIDGYSLYYYDDWADGAERNAYWKQESAVTNLGYVEFGADNGTRTINGAITDGTNPHCLDTTSPNYLKKSGTGTVTLSNAGSTYTLQTEINGGTLQVAADGALGTAPGSVSNAHLQLASGTALVGSDTFTLNANRGITLSGWAYLGVADTKTLTYNGAITDGGGTYQIVKNQGGTLVLGGANTYDNGTYIDNGTLTLNHATAAGTGAIYIGQDAGTFAATLNLASAITVANNLTIRTETTGVKTIAAAETATLSGTVAILEQADDLFNIDVASGKTLTLSGVMSGDSGGGEITMTGAGTLVLSNAGNTHDKKVTVNAGTLSLSASRNLGADPAGAFANKLTLNGGTLAATASFTMNSYYSTTLGAGNGTIDVGSGLTLTYPAAISGSGTLTKTGTGTLTLSGDNPYTGATTVGAGTVIVDNWCDESAFTVSSGATLMGDSAVDALTLNGKADPGTTAGARSTLAVDGALVLNNGGSMQVDLANATGTAGSGWDLIDVGGAITPPASGTFTILVNDETIANFSATSDYSWKIMEGASVGAFDPAFFTVDTTQFGTSFSGTFSVTNTGSAGTGLYLVYQCPIAVPAAFSVADAAADEMTLTFTASDGHDVVIIYNTTGTGDFTTPSGTPTVGASLGGGTVAYVGTSSPQAHTGLVACTLYYYKAWSYYNGRYSATGLTASDTTPSVSAPASIWANPTNYTDFTANWSAVAGASGYRLDVSTNATFGGSGTATLLTESFETDGQGTRYDSNTEEIQGDGDYYGRTTDAASGSTFTGEDGTYWFGGQDQDALTDVILVRTNTLRSLNITGYTDIQMLSLWAEDDASDAAEDWDTTDYVHVQYRIDAGAWTDLLWFEGEDSATNTNMVQDVNFDGVGDGRVVTSTFQEWTNAITGTGTGLMIRVIASVDSGDEDWAVDNIRITANGGGPDYVSGYSNLAVAATSQSVTGLTQGVDYYFRVRAEGSCGASVNSSTGTVTTKTSAVLPPGTFTATAAGMTSVDLAFTRNAANNNVLIVYDLDGTFTDPSGAPPAVGEAFAGGTVVYYGATSPQTHSSLSGCTRYYYKAWSYDGSAYSGAALTDDATTTAPSAPTGLHADPTNSFDFTAAWAAASGADGYIIDVSLYSDFLDPDVGGSEDFETGLPTSYTSGDFTLSSGTWTGTNVIRGTTGIHSGSYVCQLQSATASQIMTPVFAGGVGTISMYLTCSSGSLQVNVSTNGGATWSAAPGSPLSGVSPSVQLYTFTVNDPAVNRIQFYRTAATIYLDDISWTAYTPGSYVDGYESRPVAGTSVSVTGLTDLVTYYYRVASVSGTCTSDYTSVASVTTVVGPPPVPTGLSASDGTSPDQVALSWTDLTTKETGYVIWRSTSSDTNTAVAIATNAASVATYNDTSAAALTLYYYWVTATNAVGSSAFSTVDSGFRGLVTVDLSATACTDTTQVSLSWPDISGETGYGIWRHTADASGSATFLASAAADATGYNDATAVEGQQYYYWVRATNSTLETQSAFQASGVSGVRQLATVAVAASDGTDTSQVVVNWTDIAGETAFGVWRSETDDPGTASFVASALADATNYNDTSAVAGTQYYYWVLGSNSTSGCQSDWGAGDAGFRRLVEDPYTAILTQDGREMVRAAVVANAATNDILVLYSTAGLVSGAPVMNTGYSVGDTLGNATVIYNGVATNFREHVVLPNTTNHYKMFSVVSNLYYSAGSEPLNSPVETELYQTAVAVETFSYTNVTLSAAGFSGTSGGAGWAAASSWAHTTNSTTWTVVTNDTGAGRPMFFTAPSNQAALTGNRAFLDLSGTSRNGTATRSLTTVSSDSIYVSGIVAYGAEGVSAGTDRWLAIALMDGGAEQVEFGKIGGLNRTFGLFHGSTTVASSRAMEPYGDSSNNWYWMVMKYDFATDTATAKAFPRSENIPAMEPSTWDVTGTVSIAQVTGVRLKAGSGADALGGALFDEVRVSSVWPGMIGEPDLVVTPAAWNFGDVRTTRTATATFWVQNIGGDNVPLLVNPITLGGTNPTNFSLSTNTLGYIQYGQSNSFTVTFDPHQIQSYAATIYLTNNSGVNPVTISLQGAGIASSITDPPEVSDFLVGPANEVTDAMVTSGVFTVVVEGFHEAGIASASYDLLNAAATVILTNQAFESWASPDGMEFTLSNATHAGYWPATPANNYLVRVYLTSSNSIGSTNTSYIGSGAAQSTDLFISEYLEAGNNKAVEIYNGTGSAVDLSNYDLRTYVNGSTSYNTFDLTGTLAAGEVHVFADTSSSAAILALADQTSGSLDFNGNDAVALAKSGVNIDVLGTIGNNNVFAEDVTKVRDSSVVDGTTTYASGQWNNYAADTITYLGSHDMAGAGGTPMEFAVVDDDTNAPAITSPKVNTSIDPDPTAPGPTFAISTVGAGGLPLLWYIQDTGSGVYASSNFYTLVRSNAVIASGSATAGTDGDGKATPLAVSATIDRTNLMWGSYSLHLVGHEFDPEWAGDPNQASNVYYFSIAAPNIVMTPPSLDFGTVTKTESSNLTVTVQNNGNASLTISSIGFTGTGSGDFSVSPSSATVAAGASTTLTVTYTPSAGGAVSVTMTVNNNSPNNPAAPLAILGTCDDPTTEVPRFYGFRAVDAMGLTNDWVMDHALVNGGLTNVFTLWHVTGMKAAGASYDLLAPDGTVVLTNQPFDSMTPVVIGSKTCYEFKDVVPAIYPATLGVYTARVTAVSSNDLTLTDEDTVQAITTAAAGDLVLDDFNRAYEVDAITGWTPVITGPTNGNIQVTNNYLQFYGTGGTGGTAGRLSLAREVSADRYSTVLTNNSSTLRWGFNFNSGASTLAGFDSSQYGAAFVLGSSSTNWVAGGGIGYAVIIRSNAVALARFNGMNGNGDFTIIGSLGSFLNQTSMAVRVDLEPSTGVWSLYVKPWGGNTPDAFGGSPLMADMTNYLVTSTVDTTYLGTNDLKYVGCYWNHATATPSDSYRAVFDSIYVPYVLPPFYPADFTVYDEDTNSPTHSGFNVDGYAFTTNTLQTAGGLTVTGRVSDLNGVYGGTSNVWTLFSNSTQIASGTMTMTPSTNGAGTTNSPAALSSGLIAFNLLNAPGFTGFVFRVESTDYDVDRPDDCLVTTNNYNFFVIEFAPPCPTNVTATADGMEMVVLTWNKNGAPDVVVLRKASPITAVSLSPAFNYQMGDTVPDGSVVAYRGTADSKIELVVPEGSDNYIRVFGASGSSYSTAYADPTNNPSTTMEYESDEIVDQFAYTNFYSLAEQNGLATGQGWSGPWTGDTNTWTIDDTNLVHGSTMYPDPYANKLQWERNSSDAGTAAVVRVLANARGGRTFVAFMVNYKVNNPASGDLGNKFAGLSLMSGTNAITEEIFFGKVAGTHKYAGINYAGGDPDVTTESTYELNANHGDDYMIVGEWDPAINTVRLWAFYQGQPGPIPESYTNAMTNVTATYSNSALTAVGDITGIRLAAGMNEYDANSLDHIYFDEVRVGGTWEEVLNFNYPDATAFWAGTVINGTNYVTDGQLAEDGKSYPIGYTTYHRTGVTNASFTLITNVNDTTGLYEPPVTLQLDPADTSLLDKYRDFTNIVTVRLDTNDVTLGVYTSRLWMTAVSGKTTNTLYMEGQAGATDLFFGEFGEGEYYDKYVEIYNGTGASIDLSQYMMALKRNSYSAPWEDFCRLSPTPFYLEHGHTILILNGESINYSSGRLATMTNALLSADPPRDFLITTNNVLQTSGDDPIGLFHVGETNNWIDLCGLAPLPVDERYIMSRLEDAEVPRPYPLLIETNEWDFRRWALSEPDAGFTNFLTTAGTYDRLIGLGGFITFTVTDDDLVLPRLSLETLRPTNGVLAQYLFTDTASTAPTLVDAANASVGALKTVTGGGITGTPTFVSGPTGGTYAASATGWGTSNQYWAVDLMPVCDVSITNISFQCRVDHTNGPTSYAVEWYAYGVLQRTDGPYGIAAGTLDTGTWYSVSLALSGFSFWMEEECQIRVRPYGAATDATDAAMHLYNLTVHYQSAQLLDGVTQVTDEELASGSFQMKGNAWDVDSGLITSTNADTTKRPVFSLSAPNGSLAVDQAPLGFAASVADGGAKTETSFSNNLPRASYTNVMMGSYMGVATLWDFDHDRAEDPLPLNARLAMYVVDNDIQPPSTVGTIRVNGVVATTNTPDRFNVSWGNTPEFLVTFDSVAVDVDPGASYPDEQRVMSGIGEYRVTATNVSAMTASNRAAYGTPYPVATTNGALANYGFEMWQVGWTYDANCTFHYAGLSGDTNAVYEGTNCFKQSNGGVASQIIEFRNLAGVAPLVGVSGRYMSSAGATFLVEAFATNNLVTPVGTNYLILDPAASWTSFTLNPAAVGNGTVEVIKITLKDGTGNTTYWDSLRLSVNIGTNLPSMRFVAGVENQGLIPQYLFAVDADNNRAGDRLAGTSMPFYIAYDITPPTTVPMPLGGTGATTETVDDPTTQFDLQWVSTDVGPDDPTDANHPTQLAADKDILAPWSSYKIYYGTYNPLEVPVWDVPTASSGFIYTNYIVNGAYTNWPFKTADSEIADVNAVAVGVTNYAVLTNASRNTVRLYDLDFDQDYVVVMVGVDRAGNEGPATIASWATNNTIKFSVTSGWTLAKTEAQAIFGATVATNTTAENTKALGWLAAGQKNGTGTVTKVYDLIYRDALTFTESSNNTWGLVGTVQSNWFVDDGGQFRGRGVMRFYRASYKDRWRTVNPLTSAPQRPLASEEVYAVHNVILSGGNNFVALHGVPYTNTFYGVFGDTNVFPGGTTALPESGSTLVEFFSAGTNAPSNDQYWLNTSGQWTKVGGSDVTTTLQADGFFTRGFSITLPKPLPEGYATTTALDYSVLDTNGVPVQVPAMVWSPIVQVPTNSAGFSQVISCGSQSGRTKTEVYNVAALRLPVSAHPSQMRLLESGFVNGDRGASDEIYTMNTATKSTLSGSTIYCDPNGIWRFVTSDGLVPWGYFKPNDVIVIVSKNPPPAGLENPSGSGCWTWTYAPGHFYTQPTRWMGY